VDNALSWFNPRYGSLALRGKVEIKVCNVHSVQKTSEAVCPSDCIRWLAILLSVHVSSGKLLFMLG
jgi:hypothetical protein